MYYHGCILLSFVHKLLIFTQYCVSYEYMAVAIIKSILLLKYYFSSTLVI